MGLEEYDKFSKMVMQKFEMIKKANNSDKEDSNNPPKNKGKLLMDATVAEQMVLFPTDTGVLNESRELSEDLIKFLCKSNHLPTPRTYKKRARKDFLSFVKRKKPSYKIIRIAIKKQLNYLKRNLTNINRLVTYLTGIEFGAITLLDEKQLNKLNVLIQVYSQQLEMYNNKTRRCDNRIISVSKPYLRPIKRGKYNRKVEFGAKIGVCMVDGFARIDTLSWNAYNEGIDLKKHCESYYDYFGFYPEAVLADTIYGTKENRKYMKSKGIKFSGKPLGRPPKNIDPSEIEDKKKNYRERIPIEGKFGQGKNGYNLNQIPAKLKETAESWIGGIFFVMNIIKLAKNLASFFVQKYANSAIFLVFSLFLDSIKKVVKIELKMS